MAAFEGGPEVLLKQQFNEISSGLVDRNWVASEHFISPDLVDHLIVEGQVRMTNGEFRPAGVGKSGTRENLRGDLICWWDPNKLKPAEKTVWSKFEELRLHLNRELFFGLSHFEMHTARYAPGTYYERHLDQLAGSNERVISFVLYLNLQWNMATDGGALRLYDRNQSAFEIEPLAGRLVCFLSAEIEHEVLAPTRERLSVTGWFRRERSHV